MLKSFIEILEKHAEKALDGSVQAEIADKLNWVLVKGADAALAKPVQTLVLDADRAGAEVLQNSQKYDTEREQLETSLRAFEAFPGASLFANAIQVVAGRMDGQDVYIFPGSEGGGENTRSRRKLDLVVLLKNSLELNLHMYPEYWLAKVGKFLFRLQDIHISDELIDETFMIKAKKPKLCLDLLREPEVTEALHQIIKTDYGAPVINDVSVRNSLYLPAEADEIISYIRKLVALATALSRDTA